jgi:hypothetical protein
MQEFFWLLASRGLFSLIFLARQPTSNKHQRKANQEPGGNWLTQEHHSKKQCHKGIDVNNKGRSRGTYFFDQSEKEHKSQGGADCSQA